VASARAREIVRFCELGYGWSMRGRDVQDLGCGFAGVGAYLLVEQSLNTLTLLDANDEYAGAAKRLIASAGLARARVIHAALDDYRMETESVDLCILSDVFHYVSFDHAALVERCFRALRPGGLIILRTLNRITSKDVARSAAYAHLQRHAWAERYVRWMSDGRNTYKRIKTRSRFDVEAVLRAGGFENIRCAAAFSASRSQRSQPFSGFIHVGGQKIS
jgi:cyclopropane fatty-acyl-phospholipid synthase-like methyltransferase